MSFFSRLRSAWHAVMQPTRLPATDEPTGPDDNGGDDSDAPSSPDAAEPPAVADSDDASQAAAADAAPASDRPGKGAAEALAGTIDDYNGKTQVGIITLGDGAVIGFGAEACEGFTPLIGLRVAIRGTGVPPEGAVSPPGPASEDSDELPGLWASRIRLWPGSESEYAARLRILQVERALRGAGERDGESAPGEPPWARGKNRPGRKPSGPGRPADAFFVLTVILDKELPQNAASLAALIDAPLSAPSPSDAAASTEPLSESRPNPVTPPVARSVARSGGVWHRPIVRIIPLVRNQQSEPGFSAEIQSGSHRAFLLHRPLPYGAQAPGGRAHAGLFVGGPHSPRIAAQLSGRNAQPPVAVTHDAAHILADLARALLLAHPDAPGMVLNRAGKAFKPRDIALSQLGEDTNNPLPFVAWIDWNRGERAGQSCLLSSGLEILALPDIAVALPAPTSASASADDDNSEARARDVLLFVCAGLLHGTIADDANTLAVPRIIRLQAGSRLDIPEPHDCETYAITARSPEWIDLALVTG